MSSELREEFLGYVEKWPKFSGDREYPVPCEGMTGREAFLSAKNLWDGAYGETRRELLEWALSAEVYEPPKKWAIPKLKL